MGVSQKVKQQRSICEFLFCLKNEAQTRTEKELRAQLGERAVPKSALFSFIERPQGVPLFRSKRFNLGRTARRAFCYI